MTAITFLGHSSVSVGHHDRRLVIDPGIFSDLSSLPSAEAILVTHEHADHLAPGVLADTSAEVWAPPGVIAELGSSGIASDRLHAVGPGESFEVAGMSISVHGGEHAEVYPGVPRPANNAYLIDGRILHPGDSFAPVLDPGSVDVLLLPVAAPWLKLAEAIAFARDHKNATACPIHDAVLNEAGHQLTDRILTGLLGAGRYQRTARGETLHR